MGYNKYDPLDIERYAKKLIGKTFNEVLTYDIEKEEFQNMKLVAEEVEMYGKKKRKGGLGNLIEEKFFGYKANSLSEADFKDAGVELKVTPYEKNNKGFTAGERLVLTMIPFDKPIEEDFFKSNLWHKCELILLIFYLRNKLLNSNLDYRIDYVRLFRLPKEDLKIIISDYKIIVDKIIEGKANELSESDTMYLGACTKGATAESSLVPQYYNPNILAKKRAFSFKQSYMKFILNEYIIGDNLAEKIIDDEEKSFEEILKAKINKYVGKTDVQIAQELGVKKTTKKSFWIQIAYNMLGIKSNKAEEFEKSNTIVKAIRVEENNKIVESSSLPAVKLIEVANIDFDNSSLKDYFDETRFFFVVFKKVNDEYILRGFKLWNMPFKHFNIVREEYEKIREVLRKGVEFKNTNNGIQNNLPKKKKNGIIHIRPHAQKSYYVINGVEFGNGNLKDSDELPNGDRMVKQSFWLNNHYLLQEIFDLL